jgi:hypothetical protein
MCPKGVEETKVAKSDVATSNSDGWRKIFAGAAFLAALGMAGYAACYLLVVPSFSPGSGLVPDKVATGTNWFGVAQGVCLLVYAFAFLPVALMFSIRQFNENPYAVIVAVSLVVMSLVLEIVSNLPALAVMLYSGKFANASSDTVLYFRQLDAIKYLAFEIAGFTCAYAALLSFSLIVRKSRPILFRLVLESLVVFVVGAGFLPLSPAVSLVLIAGAVLALAPLPVLLGRIAADMPRPEATS